VKRALGALPHTPLVLRSLVHNGDCWPTGPGPGGGCAPGRIAPHETMPDPTGLLSGYMADLRIDLPFNCGLADFGRNPKLRAIAAHASQTRGDLGSYLFAFAKKDEPFFTERPLVDGDGAGGRGAEFGPAAEGFALLARERQRVNQSAPMSLVVRITRPAAQRSRRVAFYETQTGRYILVFDGGERRVDLLKESEQTSPVRLAEWLLPHDTWRESDSSETFEMRLTRPSARALGSRGLGSPLEIELLLRGDTVGSAVDPRPLPRGDSIVVDDPFLADASIEFAVRRGRQSASQ